MIRFALVLLMSLAVSSQAVAAVKWNNSSSNNSDKSSNPILQPDLGIPQDGKDTTLFGFKQKDEERFKYHGKKELLKYEKERNIKLFNIVNDNTRFGDTAFFIQAPADGCYNRWTQDCEREDAWRKGERTKRIEASYSAYKKDNIWVSLSFKMTNDWEIGKDKISITQFHSHISQLLPPIMLAIRKDRGMYLIHQSAYGLHEYMKDRREGCEQACGGNDYDAHSILPTWQIPKNEWLDFVWNINFDEDKPEDEYIKLWLNGKLVVDTEGSGKRVQWQTPEDVKKSENKMTFKFGMYGSKKDGKFHSAYFDEIGWAKSCEALDLGRLGYECEKLTSQRKKTWPRWYDYNGDGHIVPKRKTTW